MRSHDICTGSARESNHFLIGEWEVLQGQPDVAQTGSRHQFEAVDPALPRGECPTICGGFSHPHFCGSVSIGNMENALMGSKDIGKLKECKNFDTMVMVRGEWPTMIPVNGADSPGGNVSAAECPLLPPSRARAAQNVSQRSVDKH